MPIKTRKQHWIYHLKQVPHFFSHQQRHHILQTPFSPSFSPSKHKNPQTITNFPPAFPGFWLARPFFPPLSQLRCSPQPLETLPELHWGLQIQTDQTTPSSFSGLKRRGNDFSKCQHQLCARHLLLRVSKKLPPSTGHCTSGYSEPSTSQSVPRAIIPELELVQPRLERGRDSHDPPDTASKETAVKSAFSKGQSVRFLRSQVQG